MAGHIGLTQEFMEKAKLVSSKEYESNDKKNRVVYIFDTKEEILSATDLVGELVIALDDPTVIFHVSSFNEKCHLKVYRKIRKPINIHEDTNGDE